MELLGHDSVGMPARVVASVRSTLSVWIRLTGAARTRSYHMACTPEASVVIHGWKRSFIVRVSRLTLITCGALQVPLPSRETLMKIRVALLFVAANTIGAIVPRGVQHAIGVTRGRGHLEVAPVMAGDSELEDR